MQPKFQMNTTTCNGNGAVRGPGKVQKEVLQILAAHPETAYGMGFQRIRIELGSRHFQNGLQVRAGDLNRVIQNLANRGLLCETSIVEGARVIRQIRLTEKALAEYFQTGRA